MYIKTIKYGKTIEIYAYEKEPRPISRRSRILQATRRNASMVLRGENKVGQEEQDKKPRKDNARRTFVAFRRLISANLGQSDDPVFCTLTYAKGITDIKVARKDFNTFARNVRYTFGKSVRYVAVCEFHKRGTIHFHSLIWGLPDGLVDTERRTRLVASLWGQGFIDLIKTDGSPKLATYMAKYMVKSKEDRRMFGVKAYICSRNIIRPVVDKRAILSHVYYVNELSTDTEPLQEKNYLTQWLGECNYKVFDLNS